MDVNLESTIPIYIQIAESIEDLILEGKLKEGEQAPSTNQLSAYYKLNPATARKGLNILADKNILYKKRGLGMYVTDGAANLIKEKRREYFVEKYIMELITECKKLDIGLNELINMIKEKERSV